MFVFQATREHHRGNPLPSSPGLFGAFRVRVILVGSTGKAPICAVIMKARATNEA
jgi:hypothetical protein